MELVRTELQKKTVEAEEGSMDPVQHQAPEMLAKPHPEIPQLETPMQSTPVNEGNPHAPMYRSQVVVHGTTTYTSPNVFLDQKSAEMDAARIALLRLGPQISDEFCQLQEEDNLICKSILNEYLMKINVEKPIYDSELADGRPPAFVTSLTFNGKYYVGDKGRNKKESQQLAARAAILSILDSDARTVISKIIIRKRLSSAKDKVKSTSVEKRVCQKAKNNVGIYPQVQIAAVPSSQTCPVAQSVPNNCDPLQGFDNAVLPGPCVLPKIGSGPETHILVYWRKPAEGFIALNTDGASQNGIAAGGGILRNHMQGFDNAVLPGPCVLPKIGSGPETHILVYWRKPAEGFIALNTDGASQNGIAAGGGILRNHMQGFDNAVLPGPCVLPKIGSGPETHILVYWRKPAEGFIALNTDGASRNGIAAGGGILRNHIGEHLSNFYSNYGIGSSFFAESKAILDGLSICKELGYNKIQIQTDSLQATLCFDQQAKISLHEQSIWDEIYKFQDTLSIKIMHVYREGNKMADYLSKKGILAKGMGTIDMSVDESAKELLAGEKLGISYLKKLKNQFAEGVRENFMHTGVQIAAVPSSQLTTCTMAQSVPSNCISLQGLECLGNDVLSGPCVLPKLRSVTDAYFLVYWRKPPEGFIALNTQASHRSGIAAGGGVLRNHDGEHISNFYNNYGRVSINFAKSKAILDGLLVCKELGYNKIQIQTDSAHATLWFHRQLTVTVPLDLQTMWNEIYKFQDTFSVEILHVYREGNKLAGHLSKKGVLAEGMGAINISMDERAKELLIGGKLGISYLGKLKNQCAA